MAREDLHFRLRIPDRLKKRVEEAAALHGRSMTAEIVARLTRSFELSRVRSTVTVRIEALPPGSPPKEVTLAAFLSSFDRALKEVRDEGDVADDTPPQFVRAPDSLRDPIEDFEGDDK